MMAPKHPFPTSARPSAPPPRRPDDPPAARPSRGPRRIADVADYAALARVYAAAYQGHAEYGFSEGDCRISARDAVRHFCTVLDEPAT